MSYMAQYLAGFDEILGKIKDSEGLYQEIASKIMDRFEQNGIIFFFGAGHSHLLSLEAFCRAGGLSRVCPVLDERFMLHISVKEASAFERTEGVAREIFDDYGVTDRDVFVVMSNSGINPLIVEMAQIARDSGALTISITNLNHSRPLESRHKNGKKLYEICEYTLDNFGPFGDASVPTSFGVSVSPTSTAAGCVIIQSLVACVTQEAEKRGFELELGRSGNLPPDPAHMERRLKLLERFKDRLRYL